MKPSRRQMLGGCAASLALAVQEAFAVGEEGDLPHVATNTYPWLTFARRAQQKFETHSDQLLQEIAACGIAGYEPIVNRESEFEGLSRRLADHGLQMRSIYVNSVLHDAERVEQSMSDVIQIAIAAKELGTKIIVTNPSPIRWGGDEDKSDSQLRLQAESLDSLGAQLRSIGIELAYHNHDAELRQGGREFHHMLTATDPQNVKFCLDAHWVYRGCGNSEVAVFDALTHYRDRIVELHLRQSSGGVWTESFAMNGDIDYRKLFAYLAQQSIKPHLVLEQAIEEQSPKKLDVVEAHRRGHENLQRFLG